MNDPYPTVPRTRRRPIWLRILSRWRWVVFPAIGVLAVLAALAGARELGERVRDALAEDSNLATGPVTVEIPLGSTAAQIAQALADNGIIASANAFEREVRARGVTAELKAGIYNFEGGLDTESAVDALVEGPGRGNVYIATVIEGLTIAETLDSLALQTPYTATQLGSALLSGEVFSTIRPGPYDELADWEGMLFPDTYEFDEDALPAEILQRMSDTMRTRVDSIDWSRLEELDVTRYEAIVIASMIEREAGVEEDRPLIASVIYNRLAIGQILGIDATVIYARGYREGEITLEDLAIQSPYNTRLFPGLPPTPIATARLASLEAAADPADTSFFYYVLVDAGGKHGFAETAAEFEALKAQARREGIIP